jgi:hypothetical protein
MGLVLHAVLCMMYFPQVWIDNQRYQGSRAMGTRATMHLSMSELSLGGLSEISQ